MTKTNTISLASKLHRISISGIIKLFNTICSLRFLSSIIRCNNRIIRIVWPYLSAYIINNWNFSACIECVHCEPCKAYKRAEINLRCCSSKFPVKQQELKLPNDKRRLGKGGAGRGLNKYACNQVFGWALNWNYDCRQIIYYDAW